MRPRVTATESPSEMYDWPVTLAHAKCLESGTLAATPTGSLSPFLTFFCSVVLHSQVWCRAAGVLVVRAVCPPAAVRWRTMRPALTICSPGWRHIGGFVNIRPVCSRGVIATKTLTGLAGSEPVKGAQHAAVQRLQYFLSQFIWDADQVNDRRLVILINDPATAPHAHGVIAIDDSGDRKDGTRTAHVGRQWLGRRQTAASNETLHTGRWRHPRRDRRVLRRLGDDGA